MMCAPFIVQPYIVPYIHTYSTTLCIHSVCSLAYSLTFSLCVADALTRFLYTICTHCNSICCLLLLFCFWDWNINSSMRACVHVYMWVSVISHSHCVSFNILQWFVILYFVVWSARCCSVVWFSIVIIILSRIRNVSFGIFNLKFIRFLSLLLLFIFVVIVSFFFF